MSIIAIVFLALAFCGGGVLLATNSLISAENSVSSQDEEVSAQASGFWTDQSGSFQVSGKTITINSVSGLGKLLYEVNTAGRYRDYTIKLGANTSGSNPDVYDMSAHYWTPLMLSGGTFDGQGRNITGINIYSDKNGCYNESGTACFGFLAKGTIKNVMLEGKIVAYSSHVDTSDIKVGGAVAFGTAYGVANINLDIEVYINDYVDDCFVGGIVGTGNAYDCVMQNRYGSGDYSIYVSGSSSGSVYALGVGGIVGGSYAGDGDGSIGANNCCSYARIHVNGVDANVNFVGGIAGGGYKLSSSYSGPYADVTVSGCVVGDEAEVYVGEGNTNRSYSREQYGVGGVVGGVYGTNADCWVYDCINYGFVDSWQGDYWAVGGIVGVTPTDIENCSNFGRVDSFAYSNTGGFGGIVGRTIESVSIENCGSYGDINAWGSSQCIGGIVGFHTSGSITVKECIVYAMIDASNERSHVGYVEAGATSISFKNSYDFRKHRYTCTYNTSVSYSAEDCYYLASDYYGAVSTLTKLDFSASSTFNTSKKWLVVKSGTCGFGSYYGDAWGGYYSYLVLPMHAFRQMKINAYKIKPSQTTYGEYDSLGESASVKTYDRNTGNTTSMLLYVNGKTAYTSFYLVENDSEDLTYVKWDGVYVNNGNMKVPDSNTAAFSLSTTISVWNVDVSSNASSGRINISTRMFYSGSSDLTFNVYFRINPKAITVDNDTNKGTYEIVAVGLRAQPETSGIWKTGMKFYRSDTGTIVVTPKLGYYVKSISFGGAKLTHKVYDKDNNVKTSSGHSGTYTDPALCGVAKASFTIGAGNNWKIEIKYEEVIYNAQIYREWDNSSSYSGYSFSKTISVTMSDGVELGFISRVYYSEVAISTDGLSGYDFSSLPNIDGHEGQRSIDLTKNGQDISPSFTIRFEDVMGKSVSFKGSQGDIGQTTLFNSIYNASFYLYLTKERVSFDLQINNMANSLDNLNTVSRVEYQVDGKTRSNFSFEDADKNNASGALRGGWVDIAYAYENSEGKTGWSKSANDSYKINTYLGGAGNDINSEYCLTLKEKIEDGSVGMKVSSLYGWLFKGLSFSEIGDLSGLDEDFKNNQTYGQNSAFWQQFMLWKYADRFDDEGDVVTGVLYNPDLDNSDEANMTFVLYSYHVLDTYEFNGLIELDGVNENSLTSESFMFVTDEGYTDAENEKTSYDFVGEKRLHYLANAAISCESSYNPVSAGINPYVFEGYYLKCSETDYKLLTSSRQFVFSNDNLLDVNKILYVENKADEAEVFKLKNLTIVARFTKNATAQSSGGLQGVRGVYEIWSKNDLIALAKDVAEGKTFENCIINQMTDIDLNGVIFNPIGDENNPFKGTYNGNHHLIKNLKTSGRNGSDVSMRGLFGHTDGATIKNLTIYSGNVFGKEMTGAVVGKAVATKFERVSNFSCEINNEQIVHYNVFSEVVTTPDGERRSVYGGLVGLAENCSFFACSNKAQVGFDGSSEQEVYGLIGRAAASVVGEGQDEEILVTSLDQCYNEGEVYGNAEANFVNLGQKVANSEGGLVAAVKVSYCYNGSQDGEGFVYYNSSGGIIDGTPTIGSIWANVNGNIVLRTFYWY